MKQKPMEIFIRYLGEQYLGFITPLDIMDGLPEDVCIYERASFDDCWAMYVPHLKGSMCIGESRLVAISKKTGKVVFDQMVGQ